MNSPAAQILRLSQRNEPADLDPARVTISDEFAVLRALSEGLLIPAPNAGEPLPGVATHFDVSADGLTYTFHLRADARWSNGESVTAQDFLESYRRLLTPATAAPKAAVFFPVKNARAFVTGELDDSSAVGFRAPDARTFVVTLEHPSPRFPHYVASGPWIPVNPRVVARHGRTWTRPENFVGNGPFALAAWTPHQRIVVRKSPTWHSAANVALDEIHFIHFDDGDAEDRAFRAGQIDATMSVPFGKVDVYPRERPAEFHRAEMIETRYLSFNTRRTPLGDPRVRRALALAIDRDTLVTRVIRGGQPVATHLIPPLLRWTAASGRRSPSETENTPDPSVEASAQVESRVPPSSAALFFDPATARALLSAAGFAEPGTFPKLEVTAWSKSHTAVLETIQAMWREYLGIDITIAIRDAKVHWAALAAGDYDIAYVTSIPDVADPANMLADFASDSPENYPHWSDSGFDAVFRQALATAAPAARTELLHAAEDILLRAAPIAPLYFNTKLWLLSPRVRGWQEDGLWTRCYQNISLDEK